MHRPQEKTMDGFMSRHIPAEPLLSMGLLLKAWTTSPSVDTPNLRLYSFARHAIAHWAKERGVVDGALYVPAYICDDAVAALEQLGQRIVFYPVQETLKPDWDWLNAEADSGARAFLLVHYFGFPNDLETAQEFCRRRGLLLAEDCAHSFLTRHRGETIGTFGDAGFYSFYKTLPLPDGAGTFHVGGTNGATKGLGGHRAPTRELLRRLAEYALHRVGVSAWVWNRLRAGYARAGQSTGQVADGPMSIVSRRLMKALEPRFSAIESKRRENYRHLSDAFRSFPEARPLFSELPEGVCPYAFPILTEDRHQLVAELRSAGVPAQGWPTLPGAVAGSPHFEVARRYASELMLLPVHQDLGHKDMSRIVAAYRRVRRLSPAEGVSELVT